MSTRNAQSLDWNFGPVHPLGQGVSRWPRHGGGRDGPQLGSCRNHCASPDTTIFHLDVILGRGHATNVIFPGVPEGMSGVNSAEPRWHVSAGLLVWGRAMRAAIFVDGAYLNKVLQASFGSVQIAYDRLSLELSSGYDLLRTYYYDAPPYQSDPPSAEEKQRFASRQAFFAMLRKLPRFEVREGRCQRIWDRDRNGWKYVQKRVDVLFSVDLVRLASKQQIQRAILIAGDSDFLPAVSVAKDEGVSVQLIHSPDMKRVHRDLWDHVDDRLRIDSALIDRIKK